MTTQPAPDPLAILLAEHMGFYTRFDAYEAALSALDGGGASVRQALEATRDVIAYLDGPVDRHAVKEERTLFPRLKAALPADDRLIDEMVAEHDQIRLKRDGLRAALENTLSGDDHHELRQECDALRAALAAAETAAPSPAQVDALARAGRAAMRTARVHFQNEEEIVFPLTPELLSPEEIAAAGREIEAMSAEAGAGGDVLPAASDLRAIAAELHASAALARDGRTARTLINDGPLRVLLVALAPGGRLRDHRTPGALTLHALSGDLTVQTGSQALRLRAGELLTLPGGTTHAVEALEAGTLLVTFAAPPGAE